ncbi:hypothetical protein [Streptomyces aureus]|uniref:hypothetical protein n=1 Tax=Streptomyces aureus TaxID=193461 RepID=UPI00056697FC|nr:hypothetical protein [Streptomyces aureus]
MTDTHVRLPGATVQAISDQLEGRGWDPEYVTDVEIKMTFPDPSTGFAMQFSEFWLSWRLVDGRLAFGVGDDYGAPERTRLDWRTRLDVEADTSAQAVALAADRAMHWLWHCDERDALRELHDKIRLLGAMETRMKELGRRLMVTPGMVRDALKPSGSWTP